MFLNQTRRSKTRLCQNLTIVTLSVAALITGACEGEPSEGCAAKPSDEKGLSSELSDESMVDFTSQGEDIDQSDPIGSNTLDIIVEGYDECNMARAYFPKEILEEILPEDLSVPGDEVMAEHYPETELKDDAHPFLMAFCHGSHIHDVYTNFDFPEQEELLFLFPVLYTNEDGESFLSSYVPVLYLDSFMGTVGGLIFGLRKEYHANMEHGATDAGRWWSIDGVIESSFVIDEEQDLDEWPPFIDEIFANPTITLSYPIPAAQLYVYETHVFLSCVAAADERFTWEYEGAIVEQSDDTWSVYSEFGFAMSRAKLAEKYFR